MNDLIGTSVVVPGANRGSGILRYIGQIQGKAGTFGGIELQGPGSLSRGKNNGDVDGVQYFEVLQPLSGLFLPWDRLRAANPALPGLERPKTRSVGSNRDSVHTPTPSQRGSPAPKGSNGYGGGSGRLSAFSRANSVNRTTYKSETLSSVSSASPRAYQPTPKKPILPETDFSEELAELRAQLAQKTRDFERKEAILLELQSTVDQLHPVLEEYEKNIEDKERKLKKQKNEYDRAREEWRSSLDLMLGSQQEAENLYEMQISDLKEELEKIAQKKTQPSSEETVSQVEALRDENALYQGKVMELEIQLKAILNENESLKANVAKNIENTDSQKSNSTDTELVSSLKNKMEMLTQDVMSMEMALQDTQAIVRTRNTQIAELEIQLEEVKSTEVEDISGSMGNLSLENWEKEKSELQETIDTLKEQLQDSTKVSESSARSIEEFKAEIATLHNQNSEKSAEIAGLRSQIEAITSSHSSELEAARSAAVLAGKEAEKSLVDSEKEKFDLLVEEKENLESTIEYLKQQLDKQPAHDDYEWAELQKTLKNTENAYQKETSLLQKELEAEKLKIQGFESEISSLQQKLSDAKTAFYDDAPRTPKTSFYSPTKSVSIPRVKGGPLPIYKPDKKLDPSEGRDDWCGLCERDGHDSLSCPYENDMF